MITLQEMDRVKTAVTAHFAHVWPLVVAGRENPQAIDQADAYLGGVQATSLMEYGVVMKMIEKASGLSWSAITGEPLVVRA